MNQNWCLVLVIWGNKYSHVHINSIVDAVYQYSEGCSNVILMTDRLRSGLDSRVTQQVFDESINQTSHKLNYTIKLSLFNKTALPTNSACVYIDLDTVVIGDLGRLTSIIHTPDDIFMLPPGGPLGFGTLRRWLFDISRGRRMAVGNSSVVVFHSAMNPNLYSEFRRLVISQECGQKLLLNDDVFISWFGQKRLKPVPNHLVVMFRREFLTRSQVYGWIRNRLPWVRQRRNEIVAVTFNGVDHKLETLLTLPEGTLHHDSKGRSGRWSRSEMGPIKDKIERAAALLKNTDTDATKP